MGKVTFLKTSLKFQLINPIKKESKQLKNLCDFGCLAPFFLFFYAKLLDGGTLMIKIFGKVHYHWQPDLSILVTYWSIAVIPVFIGLALMYESSSVPTLVFVFVLFYFMVLLAIGVSSLLYYL